MDAAISNPASFLLFAEPKRALETLERLLQGQIDGHPARQAVYQARAEMLLQIFDVAAYRGLGEMHGVTGFAETLKLDDFAENFQLP